MELSVDVSPYQSALAGLSRTVRRQWRNIRILSAHYAFELVTRVRSTRHPCLVIERVGLYYPFCYLAYVVRLSLALQQVVVS